MPLLLFLIPAIVFVGGLATDISQLNAQKRYVQSQADLAAQSAAGHLGDAAGARAVARQVVAANDRFIADTLADSDIEFGTLTREAGFVPLANQNTTAGANAVRVTVPSPFRPLLLGPFIGDESATIRRRGTGTGDAWVAFTLRNRLIGLDTRRSILNPILTALVGDALHVNLAAVGYEGLVNARVRIEDLLGLLTLGTAVELYNWEDVLDVPIAIPELLGGLVRLGALPPQAISPGAAPSGSITLGDILAMPGLARVRVGDVLPDLSLSVLDLLTTVAGLATPNPITLDLNLNVLGLVRASVDIHILHPGVTVVGRASDPEPLRAELAQIGITLRAAVGLLPSNQLDLIQLSLRLEAAQASATLTNLNCGAQAPGDVLATFRAETAPAALFLSAGILSSEAMANPRNAPPTPVLGHTQTINVTKAQYDSGVAVPVPNRVQLTNLTGPLGGLVQGLRSDLQAQRDNIDCGFLGLNCLLSGIFGLLFGLLGGLINSLTSLLSNLVPLNNLVQTLLDLLGIELAQAEILVDSRTCSPRLAH